MNFLITLLPVLNSLIDKIFPDPQKQAEAKAEALRIMAEADKSEWEAKSKVVTAEAQGQSWMQRNWRPCLMFLFMAIIGSNYIIAPLLKSFGLHLDPLPIPENMWTLLEISVGGYIVGRSGEKIAKNFNDKKFYDSLRKSFNGLTQQQVDAFNKALNEGKE